MSKFNEEKSDELYDKYIKSAAKSERQFRSFYRGSKNHSGFMSDVGEIKLVNDYENFSIYIKRNANSYTITGIYSKVNGTWYGGRTSIKVPENGKLTPTDILMQCVELEGNNDGNAASNCLKALLICNEESNELTTLANSVSDSLNPLISQAISQHLDNDSGARKNIRKAGLNRLEKDRQLYKDYVNAYMDEDHDKGPMKAHHTGFESGMGMYGDGRFENSVYSTDRWNKSELKNKTVDEFLKDKYSDERYSRED